MNPIQAIRKRLGLTQKDFAERLGCAQGTVSYYENGADVPPSTATKLIAVAAAQGLVISFDHVYGGKALPELANAAPDDAAAQSKAKDAEQKADDLRAQAAREAGDAAAGAGETTAIDAGTLAVVPSDTSAGDHKAQKFGNDPANPAPAPGLDPAAPTVRMSRVTPDHPDGPVFVDVHPEMVGDYARAGWNKADQQSIPNS